MARVGQHRIYAPYMTIYLVTFLLKTPFIHRGSGQPYSRHDVMCTVLSCIVMLML